MLNSLLIEGTITQDPEIHVDPEGKKLVKSFVLSTSTGEKGGHVLSNYIVEVSDNAKKVSQHLQKGRSVRVVGAIRQYEWMSVKDWSKVVIEATHIEIKS